MIAAATVGGFLAGQTATCRTEHEPAGDRDRRGGHAEGQAHAQPQARALSKEAIERAAPALERSRLPLVRDLGPER